MADQLTVQVSGKPQTVATGTTAGDLFDDKTIIAAKINGDVKDLFEEIVDGDAVDAITIDSADGLEVLRHSAGHVLAQAVQREFPETKLGIGPSITDGFYYDFDVTEPFTPEVVKKLEKTMMKIVKEGQTFRKRVVTEAEARELLADQPYKLELVGIKGGTAEIDDEAAGDIGGTELTVYENLRRDGSVAWVDLCRGPHVPNTKVLGNAFGLMRTSAAYWRANENNPMLQRVYGTAWASKDDLKAYKTRIEEAAKRDHRKLGAELDLFSFPEEIGSGLPVFHPNGAVMRRVMEQYALKRHEEEGYDLIYTPHITKKALFETSGHLDFYADGMYPPIHMDATHDDEGNVVKPGQDYYLKPMNCPMHNLVYQSQGRSYRDLPLRTFEFGTVYRYEKSGVVHGMTRARGFTQDDAHIYCTPEQLKEELKRTIKFVLSLLSDYGMSEFFLELSTRDDEKYIGSDEIWETSTQTLQEVADETGLELVPDPGGAAFYGPKISVQAKDAIGRTWQLSTIQLDFNLPERFDLEYTAADSSRQRPIMIHRALFGSIERFFAVLVEHYAGVFPPWLAPVQAVAVPVSAENVDYLHEVAAKMKARGLRVKVDASDERMQKKIRTHTKAKVPYLLIAGAEDQEAGAISFRMRDGSQDNGIPVDEAIERMVAVVEAREQV